MRSDTAARVAVVGAGFSGTMTAVQLARRGLAVTLFEADGDVGHGIAYGTDDPNHLLNVPAAKMSAWPDQPNDFVEWLGEAPGTFAQRRDFGRYVGEILAAEQNIQVAQVPVTSIRQTGQSWALDTANGDAAHFAAVVLALGNEPPSAPAGWDNVTMITNPWIAEAQAAIARAASEDWPVLLIGTGLTMADVMLSLDAAGFNGCAVAVSRRGLLPRAHAAHEPAPVERSELPFGNLLQLWRWLRGRSGEVGFRAAVDSLRPHTAALWQALPVEERCRFLRHARPWWDVHRHRLAPEVAARLQGMIADGRLEVKAARLTHAADALTFRKPDGSEFTLQPRLVINCTGPLGDIRKTGNPLLRQLLGEGIVQTDPLGIGLLTDADDRAAPNLWALGPLTKGMYWEITAVPDIRVQAERIATAIDKELRGNG